MIKRRFYREEHGDRNEASSSSSSSDSEVDVEASDESEDGPEPEEKDQLETSPSSGYESEDSSANEIEANSSGFINEDDETGNDRQIPVPPSLSGKYGAAIPKKGLTLAAVEESVPSDMTACVLKCKSVYRCRICPRVVCLSEETMRTHLHSKRHARSQKLLEDNRLKTILNSDGEIENQETPTEMNARILALAEDKSKKKNKGRQRQRKRSRKQKEGNASKMEKARASLRSSATKKRKNN